MTMPMWRLRLHTNTNETKRAEGAHFIFQRDVKSRSRDVNHFCVNNARRTAGS